MRKLFTVFGDSVWLNVPEPEFGFFTFDEADRLFASALGELVLTTLKAHRHLRGETVFAKADGERLIKGGAKRPLWAACKRGGLRLVGWHVLRHTFEPPRDARRAAQGRAGAARPLDDGGHVH